MHCLSRILLQRTWQSVPYPAALALPATSALSQVIAGQAGSTGVTLEPVLVLGSSARLQPYSSTPTASDTAHTLSNGASHCRNGSEEATSCRTPAGVLLSRATPTIHKSMNQAQRLKAIKAMQEPGEYDTFDTLEFMLWLKEKFMKQDTGLPDGTKELIFSHHWDKALIDVRRTVKVTKSTKLETYHAVACVGNFEGLFGVGITSSNSSQHVVGEAYIKAYQNLVPIPLYRNHTVYHRIEHKFHTIKMIIMPRPEGFGVVASPVLRELCNMIGIKNISIKVYGRHGRKNKFDLVKCFLEAMQRQSAAHHGIEGTGVYAKEVYYRPRLPFGLRLQQLMP